MSGLTNSLDAVVVPGAWIEIFSRGAREADNRWNVWEVLDWETPRVDDKGRWRFTARQVQPPLGPYPMMVEAERIRDYRGPASGLAHAIEQARPGWTPGRLMPGAACSD